MTRTAISARLAMRTLRNMGGPYRAGVLDTGARSDARHHPFRRRHVAGGGDVDQRRGGGPGPGGRPRGGGRGGRRPDRGAGAGGGARGRRRRDRRCWCRCCSGRRRRTWAWSPPAWPRSTPAGRWPASKPSLKWPNDLVVEGRGKLAGILAETAPDGGVVVGLGLNVDWGDGAAPRRGDVTDRRGRDRRHARPGPAARRLPRRPGGPLPPAPRRPHGRLPGRLLHHRPPGAGRAPRRRRRSRAWPRGWTTRAASSSTAVPWPPATWSTFGDALRGRCPAGRGPGRWRPRPG